MLALLAVVAVQTGYQTDFENPAGWTLFEYPPGASVRWSFDATPAGVAGGPSRGGKSLNYNTGVDYASSDPDATGSATSSIIDLRGMPDPRLVFWCNFVTEPGSDVVGPSAGSDLRILRFLPILSDGQEGVPFGMLLDRSPDHPLGPCAAMGTWHRHEYRLAQHGSLERVRVQFQFSAGDVQNNGFPGWFIDDLSVAEPSAAEVAPLAGAGGAAGGGDDPSSERNCGALGLEVLAVLAAGAARRRRFHRSRSVLRRMKP